MKILYWTCLFPPSIGGIESFSRELVAGLRLRGHDLIVIAHQTSKDLPKVSTYVDTPVYRFNFSEALVNRNLAQLKLLVGRVKALKHTFAPDVVHVNDGSAGLFFHLNTASSCPTICTLHQPYPHDVREHPLLVRLLLEAAHITTVSQAVYEAMRPFEAIMPRTSVLLNGLTMPSLAPVPLPTDPAHFLCVGRLVAEKGFDLALEAVALLLPYFPTLRLGIAGDGECRSELEALARRLNIEQAVQFLGWVEPEEIPALINRSTAVVVPSRWQEPFGLVALQAGQMARPAVVARVGGLPEIVTDGVSGWVVEPANSAALAEAMRSVLENPAEATRRGMAARQRATSHFSGERMVDEYERLFATVIRGTES